MQNIELSQQTPEPFDRDLARKLRQQVTEWKTRRAPLRTRTAGGVNKVDANKANAQVLRDKSESGCIVERQGPVRRAASGLGWGFRAGAPIEFSTSRISAPAPSGELPGGVWVGAVPHTCMSLAFADCARVLQRRDGPAEIVLRD